MKPENQAAGESTRTESSSNNALELTEDEKVLMNLLKELKRQSCLRNKKWDKAIKGLPKNNLAKVEKTDESLFISLV